MVRKLAWKVRPEAMAERARALQRQARVRSGAAARARAFAEKVEFAVQGGPFMGLQYPTDGLCYVDALTAKLLGTYEQELHPTIDAMLKDPPRCFVDFGAAEGYYAVGVALTSPDTRVLAYELSPSARAACAVLARRNGVEDRIEQRSQARLSGLSATELDHAVVLCDIEGHERDVFTEEHVDLLMRTRLIIETHDTMRRGTTDVLRDRFARSHEIDLIDVAFPRPPRIDTVLAYCQPEDVYAAMEEGRKAARWIVCTPHTRP